MRASVTEIVNELDANLREAIAIDSYAHASSSGYQLANDLQPNSENQKLFDADYQYPTNVDRLNQGIPARGQQWQLGISYSF